MRGRCQHLAFTLCSWKAHRSGAQGAVGERGVGAAARRQLPHHLHPRVDGAARGCTSVICVVAQLIIIAMYRDCTVSCRSPPLHVWVRIVRCGIQHVIDFLSLPRALFKHFVTPMGSGNSQPHTKFPAIACKIGQSKYATSLCGWLTVFHSELPFELLIEFWKGMTKGGGCQES